MNQRMIDLYKEACEFAYKVCREEGRTGGPSDHIWNTLSTGRFAELIVRECIAQASISNGHGNNQWDKALTFAADNIKKHFGVKE